MARNQTVVDAPRGEVFEILLDAATYPAWVAGTKRLARIEPEWPAQGSAFWIKFAGGAREDKTEIVEVSPPERVVLRPHVRPFGITRVVLELESRGTVTKISMHETMEWPTPTLLQVVGDILLYFRNVQALRRLKRLAESRAPRAATASAASETRSGP